MLKRDLEYEVIAGVSPPDGLYEVIDGEFVQKPMSARSQTDGSLLHELVAPFTRQHGLERFVTETVFAMPGLTNRYRPDLAFVSYTRWPQRRRVPEPEGWEVLPEIAVEVMSPSNGFFDLERKMRDYFLAGVSEVWVVSPLTERILVHTSLTDVRILDRASVLTSPLLPGLSLRLMEIFPDYDDEPLA